MVDDIYLMEKVGEWNSELLWTVSLLFTLLYMELNPLWFDTDVVHIFHSYLLSCRPFEHPFVLDMQVT